MKEGIGKPQYPDIAFDADVKMSELSFEKLPDPEVKFKGSAGRMSVWKSWRENLPNRVQEGVVYRDAEVRLRIATEVVEDDSGSPINPNGEGVRNRLRSPEAEGRSRETESK